MVVVLVVTCFVCCVFEPFCFSFGYLFVFLGVSGLFALTV